KRQPPQAYCARFGDHDSGSEQPSPPVHTDEEDVQADGQTQLRPADGGDEVSGDVRSSHEKAKQSFASRRCFVCIASLGTNWFRTRRHGYIEGWEACCGSAGIWESTAVAG